MKTYFFSFMRLCSKSPSSMPSDTAVVSIAAIIFNSCDYYNSYTWSKDIALTELIKVVLSGMYN